jgi:hypothetical protein
MKRFLKQHDYGKDMKNHFVNEVDFVMRSMSGFLDLCEKMNWMFFRAHEIYNNDMERKIKFLMRKNRVNPWPWN